jgi:hypothetical protein
MEIDDHEYPMERVTREYIRYKFYRPEQIDTVTRVAVFYDSADSKVKLRGRITLHNGTTKSFGEESIKELTPARSAAERNLLGDSLGTLKERSLTISGVEPGAILEYRSEWTHGNGRPRRLTVRQELPVDGVEEGR